MRLGVLFPGMEDAEGEESLEDGETQVSVSSRVRQFTTHHVKVLSSLALAAVILATWMVMRAQAVPLEEPVAEETQALSWSPPEPTVTPEPTWMIHVVGAVVSPGVVTVPEGGRVIDAVEAAGGFSDDADPGDLNLAAMLADGCQVVIGTSADPKGEVRIGLTGNHDADIAVESSSSAGSSSVTINLNRASETELQTLPGVGPVTAKAILAWRDKNGSFNSVSQLQEVSGIGPKTFAQIEPYVSV